MLKAAKAEFSAYSEVARNISRSIGVVAVSGSSSSPSRHAGAVRWRRRPNNSYRALVSLLLRCSRV